MKNSHIICIIFAAVSTCFSTACKKVDYKSHDNKGETILTLDLNYDTTTLTDSSIQFSIRFMPINDLDPTQIFEPKNIEIIPFFNNFFKVSPLPHTYLTPAPSPAYQNVFHFHNFDNKSFYDEHIGFFLEEYLVSNQIKQSANKLNYAFYNLQNYQTEITPVDQNKFYLFKMSDGETPNLPIDLNSYLKSIDHTIGHLINASGPANKHITLFNYSPIEQHTLDSNLYKMVKHKLDSHQIKLNFIGHSPDYTINSLVLESGGFESIAKRHYGNNENTNANDYIYPNDLALKSSNVTLQNLHLILSNQLPSYQLFFKLEVIDPYFKLPNDKQALENITLQYNGLDFRIPKLQ